MEDTIAAIATPFGEGGIGIIRISGERALPVLEEIFEAASDKSDAENRMLRYGRIIDRKKDHVVDECLAVFMKGPATYTGEDVAEIHCHGSMISLRNALSLIYENDVRPAEPGEFTKRAFLSGRLDLSQAEAVMDVVKARSDRGFDVAMSQLGGSLSRSIGDLRSQLMDALVDITVNLDYPDEDTEEITLHQLSDRISPVSDGLEKLIASADTGRMIREGLAVTICGRPNVGKSSLLNALLKQERAIVTDIPGTTRDTIQESMTIRGIPVNLTDTAGIHDTRDVVEQMGIQRSKDAFNRADLIILILDGGEDLTEEDRQLLELLRDRKALIVINKMDQDLRIGREDIIPYAADEDILFTSALTGDGIDRIEERIEDMVFSGKVVQETSEMVTNVRHLDLLRKAKADLDQACDAAARGEPLELVELDVRSAWDHLGEIIGDTASADILDEVFSRFCLGK